MDSQEPKAATKTIGSYLGKTLTNIVRSQYFFNDIEDIDGMGDLELTFDDNTYLTLKGQGDAESIKIEDTKLKTPDTFRPNDNDICSWKRIDLTNEDEWRKLIGKRLKKCELELSIKNDVSDKLTACTIYFDNDFITFYETGSDCNRFFVNRELPSVDKEKRIVRVE